MRLRDVLAVLVVASCVTAACTTSDDDAATTSAGGGSTTTTAGAGGSGGGNTPSCTFWDLVGQACTELMHTELFVEPDDCLDEGFYADAAEWQATLTDCADPNDDPLADYDWSQPVLVVEVTIPGCGGQAEFLGLSSCMDGVHVGTSNTPGCCGCGDWSTKIGVAVEFMEGVTVHVCGSSSCEVTDMCG
jgi:hypothetical protein